jgi:hypothetical protein
MSDDEFEILDQLYFVTSYNDLSTQLELDADSLQNHLLALLKKGYIKALSIPDLEIQPSELEESNLTFYFYLATKKGLLAHNTN